MPLSRSRQVPRPSLPLILFCVLLAILWLAGGAARGDAAGQVFVRTTAIATLLVLVLFGERATVPARVLWVLLAAAAAVVALQLIPLPPELWQALPGRALFAQATLGGPQPWRPIAIVPGAAMNALASLTVPLAMLAIVTRVPDREWTLLPGAVLIMIFAAFLLGLAEFSGVSFNNPFINDTVGDVSSAFANRNHFALLLASGCLLVPVWATNRGRSPARAAIGLGLIVLFVLLILATGSRAGVLLGALALVASVVISRKHLSRALRRAPRWAFPALIASLVGLVLVLVFLSVAVDRAVAIQRLFTIDAGQDMRTRAFPTVWAMVGTYFPVGSGFGGFDPVFRVHEPMRLLKPTFFNHAHNDYLEIALDGGVAGVLLLAAAISWWCIATVRAWRASDAMLPRIGSAMLLLIGLASAVDYPARTPTMMALAVIAALWLHRVKVPQRL